MTTWISELACPLALVGLAALTACAPAVQEGAPPRSMALAGGALVLRAPSGFCIDREATFSHRDAAVVLLADCRALGGGGGLGARPVVATLTLVPAREELAFSEVLPELAALFASPDGRARLARSGRAGDVEIISVREMPEAGVFALHFRDRSPGQPEGLRAERWQGWTLRAGRLITVTLRPSARARFGEAVGYRLLLAFLAGVEAPAPGGEAG